MPNVSEHEDAAPYKEFIREMTLRIERALRSVGDEVGTQRDQLRAQREESRAYFEALRAETKAIRAETKAIRAETREIIEEGRAQRKALFRMLDRLDDGGGAATSG